MIVAVCDSLKIFATEGFSANDVIRLKWVTHECGIITGQGVETEISLREQTGGFCG